ncbi:hypothetical protein DDJ69_31685 [Klebsiella oxytoca]|nr:hypothetical protein DDJ69_31685 [Klebsiella oxytoca]
MDSKIKEFLKTHIRFQNQSYLTILLFQEILFHFLRVTLVRIYQKDWLQQIILLLNPIIILKKAKML